jgi:hypothetical protein
MVNHHKLWFGPRSRIVMVGKRLGGNAFDGRKWIPDLFTNGTNDCVFVLLARNWAIVSGTGI